MCKYCEEFTLSDSDEKDGWKFFEADNAKECDNAGLDVKIKFLKFYNGLDEHPCYGLEVEAKLDFEYRVPITIDGKDNSFRDVLYTETSANFDFVQSCPWCGRDLTNDKKE